MKKLVTLITIICLAVSVNSQDLPPGFPIPGTNGCPPTAWCDLGPNTPTHESESDPGSIGDALNADPCKDQDYATQFYCYLGKFVADHIACSYGKDTPQYTLCEEKNVQTHKRPGFTLLAFSENANAKKVFKQAFSKYSVGSLIHQFKSGVKIKLIAKYYKNKRKTDYIVVFGVYGKSGNIMGRPYLVTSKDKLYLLNYKSTAKKRKSKSNKKK